jgi:glycosyltransferase involved in cell wall biosynthesis
MNVWEALLRRVAHGMVRLGTAAHLLLLKLPRRRVRSPAAGEGLRLLLTGTFHSEAWVRAHVGPLAAAQTCSVVRVVSSGPVPTIPGVEWVLPPRLAARLLGVTGARLATFVWHAIRGGYHVVGGFHLLINGLLAITVARFVGARSLYLCVGGPAEMDDGGIHGENRLFSLMPGPDRAVERRLLRAADAADIIVVMGTSSRQGLLDRGIRPPVHVNGGGMDPSGFEPAPPGARRDFDLVFVGRLAPIKRVDLFLEAVALVARAKPTVRAVVIGDGVLRAELERQTLRSGLESRVLFAGHQRDVPSWLRRSRLLVLTSESESLPLSAIEAMMCGLPVVAPAVGDLSDVVEDGLNGHLVRSREPEAFAKQIAELLRDEERFAQASRRAREAGLRYTLVEAARRWDALLSPGRSG